MSKATLEREFFTKQQLADLLSCSVRTIDNFERAGLIKAMRRGRFVRYPLSEVQALRAKLSE